jgi:SET domain-containing protein
MVFVTTTIRSSPIHGRGMFATRRLERGTVLERGPVLPFPDEDAVNSVLVERYAFDFDGSERCLVLGAASLCNHSEEPNAEVDIDDETGTYRLLSLRRIRQGEEILIDYGPDYWAAQPDRR